MKLKPLTSIRYILRERLKKRIKRIVRQPLLKKKVEKLRKNKEAVKVIIGAADKRYEGWLASDLPTLNALKASDWLRIFPKGGIDGILAEHVIEHWTEDKFRLFLRIVRPFLSPRGYIRIAVPDGFHHDLAYIDYVKPGGSGDGSADHKVLYNYITMTKVLSEEQYDYNLLEYFDETGQFHHTSWNINNGFIERSADYDPRNKESPLSYTSLIVDTWASGR